jgi:hypothetical protein
MCKDGSVHAVRTKPSQSKQAGIGKNTRNESCNDENDQCEMLDRICHAAISLEDAGNYVVVVGFGDECSVEGAGD